MTKQIATTKTRLNMRSGPASTFGVIMVLNQQATLEVLEQLGDWLNVSFEGTEGFVHQNYVVVETMAETAEAPAPPPPAPEAPPTVKLFGRTKSRLNLRSGPATTFKVLTTLASNSLFEVLNQQGDWLHVNVNDTQGYLHANYVTLETREVVPSPPLPARPTQPPAEPAPRPVAAEAPVAEGPLDDVPLALPEAEQIPVNPQAPLLERLVADAWNRYGSLLKALSANLGIDPAVAVAVLAVESGGRGFGDDGRMIIRFENHVFWDYWGKNNTKVFDDHFKFDPNARWLGHAFREASSGSKWITMHVRNQDIEWQVYNFAARLNLTAARMSISMGGPQIMGFNYPIIGFKSVHEMFAAFDGSERNQVIGFFDFVKGTRTPSIRLEALKNLDFVGFAKQYNGSGQAARYGGLIKSVYDIFHQLTD